MNRFKMNREMHASAYIRQDIKPVQLLGGYLQIYSRDEPGKFLCMGFHGKAQKPDFNYYYRTEDARAEKITAWVDGWERTLKLRAELKGERNSNHTLEVGNVLYTSWGYDQTNIDFYQVTSIVSPKTVEIREIGQNRTEDAWAQGLTKPVINRFIGPAMRKRANKTNNIKIESYACAHLYNGTPIPWTAYA